MFYLLTDSSETISGSNHNPNLQPCSCTASERPFIPCGNLSKLGIQSPKLDLSSFLFPNQPSSTTIKSIPILEAYPKGLSVTILP